MAHFQKAAAVRLAVDDLRELIAALTMVAALKPRVVFHGSPLWYTGRGPLGRIGRLYYTSDLTKLPQPVGKTRASYAHSGGNCFSLASRGRTVEVVCPALFRSRH